MDGKQKALLFKIKRIRTKSGKECCGFLLTKEQERFLVSQEELSEAKDQKEFLDLEEMGHLIFYQMEKGNKKVKETFKGVLNKVDRAGFEETLHGAIVKFIEQSGRYLTNEVKKEKYEGGEMLREGFGKGKDKELANTPTQVGKLLSLWKSTNRQKCL